MKEAKLEDTGSGLAPFSDALVRRERPGRGVVDSETFGSGCGFESREHAFPQVGINLSVVEPGESNCLYHSESQQEAFLVLTGECTLLVEGEERPLGPGTSSTARPGRARLRRIGRWPVHDLDGRRAGRRTSSSSIPSRSRGAVRRERGGETPDASQAYAPFERPRKRGRRTSISFPGRKPRLLRLCRRLVDTHLHARVARDGGDELERPLRTIVGEDRLSAAEEHGHRRSAEAHRRGLPAAGCGRASGCPSRRGRPRRRRAAPGCRRRPRHPE